MFDCSLAYAKEALDLFAIVLTQFAFTAHLPL